MHLTEVRNGVLKKGNPRKAVVSGALPCETYFFPLQTKREKKKALLGFVTEAVTVSLLLGFSSFLLMYNGKAC